MDYPVREMDSSDTLKTLERVASMGVRNLIITGGEPLLRGDIIEIVRGSGELNLARLLLTNGELLDEINLDALLDDNIEGITLSVNTLREAERLERVAGLLREAPLTSVTVTTVFNRDNVADLQEIYRWARGKGWGTILQPAFILAGAEGFESMSPHFFNESQWKIVDSVLREWGREQGMAYYVQYVLGLFNRASAQPRYCSMGAKTVVVDCDGSVYPCFHRKGMKAGNMLFTPMADIAKKLASFADEVSAAPCYGEHCVSLFCDRSLCNTIDLGSIK